MTTATPRPTASAPDHPPADRRGAGRHATPGHLIDPATGYDRRDASEEARAAYVAACISILRSV